jgi:hypothetical protein
MAPPFKNILDVFVRTAQTNPSNKLSIYPHGQTTSAPDGSHMPIFSKRPPLCPE